MLRWSVRSILVIIALLGAYALLRKAHRMRAPLVAEPWQVERLQALGQEAIASRDVPVAALLLHGGRLIGSGRNTVLSHGDAAGHAEVNAVSDAIRSLGWQRFNALNRDSLLLLTTFEPCAMCRGMLLEHRIGQVAYLHGKSLGHWLREDARWLLYELLLRPGAPEDLQERLFMQHPGYPESRAGQGE